MCVDDTKTTDAINTDLACSIVDSNAASTTSLEFIQVESISQTLTEAVQDILEPAVNSIPAVSVSDQLIADQVAAEFAATVSLSKRLMAQACSATATAKLAATSCSVTDTLDAFMSWELLTGILMAYTHYV